MGGNAYKRPTLVRFINSLLNTLVTPLTEEMVSDFRLDFTPNLGKSTDYYLIV